MIVVPLFLWEGFVDIFVVAGRVVATRSWWSFVFPFLRVASGGLRER